jgi:hypothetical protein
MFDAAGPEGEEAVTASWVSVRLVLKLEREYGRRRRPEISPSPMPRGPCQGPRAHRVHRPCEEDGGSIGDGGPELFPRRRADPSARMCIPPQRRF